LVNKLENAGDKKMSHSGKIFDYYIKMKEFCANADVEINFALVTFF
jgi:hypothetical protein